MSKGKWFLEYTYDPPEKFSSDPHDLGPRPEKELVKLGPGAKDEKSAMKIAKRKWKEIVSHKPSAKEKAIIGVRSDLREPMLVFRIETGFPIPPPAKDPMSKHRWL